MDSLAFPLVTGPRMCWRSGLVNKLVETRQDQRAGKLEYSQPRQQDMHSQVLKKLERLQSASRGCQKDSRQRSSRVQG